MGEAGLGLVLLVYPPVVVKLLCGAEIAGPGLVMSRVAGIALIALGVACGPAVAVHAVLTLLLAAVWRAAQTAGGRGPDERDLTK